MRSGQGTRLALVALPCVVVLTWICCAGCGGGTSEQTPVELSFVGGLDLGSDSLGFDLPAMQSSDVSALQAADEELLGTVTLAGDDAPEVLARRTTRVPIRFTVVGMGQFEATRWRVAIHRQGGGEPTDSQEKDTELEGRSRAYLAFPGLVPGRWDTTLELYGVRHGKAGSLLAVLSPGGSINADPTFLDFGTYETDLPLEITVTTGPGADPIAWTASTETPWISLSPESGTGTGTVTVTVNRVGLDPDVYTDGLVTISTDAGAMEVAVAMEVTALSGRLVYISDRSGSYEIYTADADGANEVRLTYTPGNEMHPKWSPDGSSILYTRSDPAYHLYVMDPDGGNSQVLCPSLPLSYGTWSPDGTQIAACGEDSSEFPNHNDIYVLNADGSDPVCITTGTNHQCDPAWSHLVNRIAFTRLGPASTIGTMDPDGTDLVWVTDGTTNNGYPAWSPDDAKIAFNSNRDGGDYEVYVMNADGTNETRLTTRAGYDYAAAWSPDGTKLVYASERGANQNDIYIMNADGSDPVPVIASAGFDGEPDWRP